MHEYNCQSLIDHGLSVGVLFGGVVAPRIASVLDLACRYSRSADNAGSSVSPVFKGDWPPMPPVAVDCAVC